LSYPSGTITTDNGHRAAQTITTTKITKDPG